MEGAGEFAAGDITVATAQITNVGDAIQYMKSVSNIDQPYDACKLFSTLLEKDYNEVGLIMLSRPDNGYTLVYIQQDGLFYPFDAFNMISGESIWSSVPGSDTDLDALCEKLMTTCPYNPGDAPMTSYQTEFLSTDIVTEESKAAEYLTTCQYSPEQIEQWIAEGLTVEEWAEKIRVPADAMTLLQSLNYRDVIYQDNVTFRDPATGIE